MTAEYLRRVATVGWTARRAGRFDAAVAASHFLPDAAALAAVRAARRAVFVYHLVPADRPPGIRTRVARDGERLALAWLRRTADLVFVANGETARALTGWRSVTRTAVGIETAGFQAVPRPANPSYAAAFVGRLVPTKRPQDLVRAFAVIRNALPNARFAVIGTGPEAEPARALARTLHVEDGIDWLGFTDEAEKRRVLADSATMVFPSVEEGWGIAVCEALAAGTPVVAYDLPVFREVFPAGVVHAPTGDAEHLGRAALDLIRDPERRDATARAGRKAVADYDLDVVAARELAALLPDARPSTARTTLPR
ncbi:MAG: glycosyltransferase family 4 protein [Thermoleophilia bacterium]|nr:glycosyltransferase family 4 protein [Thermoleophilia bacterium]